MSGPRKELQNEAKRLVRPNRAIPHSGLWLLSVLVGIIAGFGAVLFRGLIGLLHNLFFLGQLSLHYSANLHTRGSPWGSGIIVAPVAGAAVVAFLVKNYAMEARGHGVPEVMEAIYYHKGIIRPIVAVIKSLASAFSIGSGGSVGREGPIVQIGSAFGSSTGQVLQLPSWQRITMIAAGAGGGIAATFNTPIGGVLFAAELLLHEVSVWTLVPVVISTATATYVGRLFLGDAPSFVIPALQINSFHTTSPWVLAACLVLGSLMGLVSTLFIKAIYGFEDFFDGRIPGNYYTRHALGMLLVGIVIYLSWRCCGHYYVEGVGYATVQDVLTGGLNSIVLLLILFVLKVVVTALTLGSGGSGGIFSPSLFLGATFGAAFGHLLLQWFPFLAVTPAAFAVMGMAGVVSGTTGAAVTAIVMIFEMTLDYNVVLPMTITVALSYGVRKFLCNDSIYTLKLTRRGRHMPESMQSNFPLVRLARDVMDSRLAVVPGSVSLNKLSNTLPAGQAVDFVLVEQQGKIVGIVKATSVTDAVRRDETTKKLGEIAERKFEFVAENDSLFKIVSKMRLDQVSLFLVSTSPEADSIHNIKGVISKERIAEAMTETISLSIE